MIDALRDDFCKRTPTSLFTNTNVDEDGPASFLYKYPIAPNPGSTTSSDYSDSYSFSFNVPALFSGIQVRRTEYQHTRNTTTGEISSTATTISWTNGYGIGSLGALGTNYQVGFNQLFCDFTSTHLLGSITEIGYQFPTVTACTNTTPVAAGWPADAMSIVGQP
jgi:hypothetical protein